MKKIIVSIMCVVVVLSAFVACSKTAENDKTTTASETTTTAAAENTTGDKVETTKTKPTDKAVIKEANAIELVKSYSDEDLGLTKEVRDKCSFMVANSGVEIEKEMYINVVAVIKTENKDEKSGKTTYTFDQKGAYYISFDGKKIMRADKGNKYVELKMHEVPTTTIPNAKK